MIDTVARGIVKTVRNGVLISRYGRGYSKNELVQLGVTDMHVARRANIPIDPLRKTTYKENIERLKMVLNKESPKKVNKSKQRRINKTQ